MNNQKDINFNRKLLELPHLKVFLPELPRF